MGNGRKRKDKGGGERLSSEQAYSGRGGRGRLTRQMQHELSVSPLTSPYVRFSKSELSGGYFMEFRLLRLGVTVPGSLTPEKRDRPSRAFTKRD